MTSTPPPAGLAGVPMSLTPLGRKDFVAADQPRWCPGCGDYAILAAIQGLLPTLGIRRENAVVISGIGCSSRLPYYLNTYGLHSIHGRAPAIATGLAISRPDLAVMVVTGDGDALSIGGNHLVHALRRNVNVTIMVFNNRIYGLTKGQFSPTSELGKVTKSSPAGSADAPVNAISLALGAEATFVARTVDSDREHLTETLHAAISHRGASLVEIYQNCPVFNDGAFDQLTIPDAPGLIRLEDGKPIRTADGRVFAWQDGRFALAPEAQVAPEAIVRHDASAPDPSVAFAIARLTDAGVLTQAPIGIFRRVERPTYDDVIRSRGDVSRLTTATDPEAGHNRGVAAARVQGLLNGPDPWIVPGE